VEDVRFWAGKKFKKKKNNKKPTQTKIYNIKNKKILKKKI